MIVGITASAFDLLHAGHVAMLREAKSQCDYLIAALQVDPSEERPQKNRPVQNIVERYIQLKGSAYVDEVIPYRTESDLLLTLSALKIDVRIIGEEYKGKEFTGRMLVEPFFNKRVHGLSTSELRQRIRRLKCHENESK